MAGGQVNVEICLNYHEMLGVGLSRGVYFEFFWVFGEKSLLVSALFVGVYREVKWFHWRVL
jgi:hypothetical protein